VGEGSGLAVGEGVGWQWVRGWVSSVRGVGERVG
jgi:hypothetical protein